MLPDDMLLSPAKVHRRKKSPRCGLPLCTVPVFDDIWATQNSCVDPGWWFQHVLTILKNHGVRQWGWDDISYLQWKITHVPVTTNQDQKDAPCVRFSFRIFDGSGTTWLRGPKTSSSNDTFQAEISAQVGQLQRGEQIYLIFMVLNCFNKDYHGDYHSINEVISLT